MLQALIAGIALIAGLLLGFFIRGNSARAEKALLDQQRQKDAADLTAARAQLTQVQAESAARAGFESLATERLAAIDRLTADLSQARASGQSQQQESAATARTQAARISQLEADLANEKKSLVEKVALLDDARKSLTDQFQNLATEILDQKSKTFAEGSQKELGTLLNPLREQIKDFREKVEKVQVESTSGVAELKTLVGTLGTLNQALAEEARNLSTALRGSAKTQGDWGEFILRDLLDKAGLREGEQYSFQQSFTGIEGENGNRARTVRTDVIVHLPGGRSLVIDSKVSLTAYTDCVTATEDEPRKAALKQHLTSIRSHVDGLARAGYDRLPGIEAPDFVVLFVPIEPAFLLALQNDPALWSDAYQRGILLVGPTTLLYVIRIVNVLWQQELQARNVKEVIDQGSKLYEKFVGFVTDMQILGELLRKSDTAYASAMNKLSEGRGNLIGRVEKLRKLGIRTNKALPKALLDQAEFDEPTLAFAAAEDDSPAADDDLS